MNRLRFLLILFSQLVFVCAVFGETILFEVDGMRYNIVSRTDFTAELYDASTFKDIHLPEYVSYNGRELSVVGISSTALNKSIKTNKEINIWLTPSCSYVKTPSEKGGLTNIYISSLGDYLKMSDSPDYKKNIYYANGDPIESNVEISTDIKEINCKYAFSNISKIYSLRIEHDGLKLPEGFCSNCTNLQTVTLSPCTLGYEVFKNCTSLSAVNIMQTGEYETSGSTFESCTKLKKINGRLIGNIAAGCFNYCASLEELSLGNGNHNIYSKRHYFKNSSPEYTYTGAFNGCSKLTRLYFPDMETVCRVEYGGGTNYYEPGGSSNSVYSFFPNNHIFHFSSGGKYYVNNTEVTDFVVPDNIETLHSGAFYNISLKSFDLNKVKYLESYSIYNCGIDYLFIPSIVETIGSHGIDCKHAHFEYFKYASTVSPVSENLEYLHISNCDILGGFSECSKLHTVEIDYLGGDIKVSAFDGCRKLKSFTCKKSASGLSIGKWAFRNTGFTNFKIPEGITSISELAFSYSAIESLEFCNAELMQLIGSCYDYVDYYEKLTNHGSFANCPKLRTLIMRGAPIHTSYYYGYSPYPWIDSNIENLVFGDNWITADVSDFATGRGRVGSNYTYIGIESNLRSIKLGENIEKLVLGNCLSIRYKNAEWDFFYDKTKINYVEVKNPKPPVVSGGFSDWTFMNASLHVPEEALDRYKSDSYWGQFWNIQGEKFENESGIKDINFDNANQNIRCKKISQLEIQLVNAEKCNVMIYDMLGKNVYFTDSYEGETIRLMESGLYVIKCDSNAIKFAL